MFTCVRSVSDRIKQRHVIALGAFILGLICVTSSASAQPQVILKPRAYTLSQPGTQPVTIPAVETLSSAKTFYNYFSASSHTGFEKKGRSLLFLHRDVSQNPPPISLIITHGIDYNTSGVRQPTAEVDMDIVDIPNGVFVTQSDDNRNEFDMVSSTKAEGRWWFRDNTDGGALEGFPEDHDWSMTIDVDFVYGITDWEYYYADGTNLTLDPNKPVTIAYDAPPTTATYDVEGYENVPLTICATIASSADGTSTYTWTWVDNPTSHVTSGTTSSGVETICDTYTFTEDGVYLVELTANDGTGEGKATTRVLIHNTDSGSDNVTTLSDDFTGEWKGCLWEGYQRYGGAVYREGEPGYDPNLNTVKNDRLNLAVPANYLAGLGWETGVESKYMLGGNFDVQVDYNLPDPEYWTNLDMRGVNLLFVELMANDAGARRRQVRNSQVNANATENAFPPHLWITSGDRDHVTQIDTDAASVLGVYGVGDDPSRTAVDLRGDVWIDGRCDASLWRIRASECAQPGCSAAQMNSSYKDRYTLPYTNASCDGGGVAVDRYGTPWVGFHDDRVVAKVDRSTGQVLEEANTPGRVHGLVADRYDFIWADEYQEKQITKIDALTGQVIASYQPSDGLCFRPYGVAVDARGRIWNSHDGACPYITRFDPVTETFERFSASNGSATLDRNRGIAADSQGLVWTVSSSKNKLAVFDVETGSHVSTHNTCNTPVGVALDRNNRVWVACRGNDGEVWEFARDGSVLATIDIDGKADAYSDMTSYGLRNFGTESWKEDFLNANDAQTDSYYLSSLENNYGGGIEDGNGNNSATDPTQAPVRDLVVNTPNVYQINRMKLSELHYTDSISRIVSQPSSIEGVWGVRTPNADRAAQLAEVFSVVAKEDLDVYVAVDANAVKIPDWLSPTGGYASVPGVVETASQDRSIGPYFNLYKKEHSAGDKISFGGNEATSTSGPATFTSCAEIAKYTPLAPSGDYTIDTGIGGPQTVYCDMDSDGGVGHTMVRVTLSNSSNVQNYISACQARGMELIVPRSKGHAEAIVKHFGVAPNLINVYPRYNGAQGLHNWEGICANGPCSFYISDTDSAACNSGYEPNGDNDIASPLYRTDAASAGCEFGRWNDFPGSSVIDKGWAICSTNDAEIAPAKSCDEILFNRSQANVGVEGISGVYPLTTAQGENYHAYCDMKYDGGGWTLALKADGHSSNFHYDSSYWTSANLYNTDSTNLDGREAKLRSFASVPFHQTMLAMATSYTAGADVPYNNFRRLVIDNAGSSLLAKFSSDQFQPTNLGRNTWKGLIPGSSLQPNCNREGFNNYHPATRVRLGIISNQENDCNTPDSRIGIGGRGNYCGQPLDLSSGNSARCAPDNGDKDIYGMGALLVRQEPVELVGHWRFNGNAQDSSPKNNHGNIYNGASYTAGVSGFGADRALAFDGVNDYFRVSDNDSLDNGSMTVALWVYLDSDPDVDSNNNWRSLIRKGSTAGTTTGFDVVLEEWGNRSIAFDTGGQNGGDRWWPSKMEVPVGKWTHLTLAYDAHTETKYAWMNGELLDMKTVPGHGQLRANSEPLFVSNNSTATPVGSGSVPGKVDDVRLYDGLIPTSTIEHIAGEVRAPQSSNYFVYFVPKALTTTPPSPGQYTIIEDPVRAPDDSHKDTLSVAGKLRIVRTSSFWSFFYADTQNKPVVWKRMGDPLELGTQDVRILLRTRLDPFWHSGPSNNPGGPINIQYDDYKVNSADEVLGMPVEVCDGIDNDCDGRIDEDFPGKFDPCQTGQPGICGDGYLACSAGGLECRRINEPAAETCDNIDNDCDGEVDNYVDGGETADGTHVNAGESCENDGLVGPCRAGQYVCDMGVMACQGATSPSPDICDGIDNDCDGTVDNTTDHVFFRTGRYLLAKQRSMPFVWPRPVEGTGPFFTDNGDNTDDFVRFDGTNSAAAVHELRKARIVFYLDPTQADNANPEGKYVLYLTQGVIDANQGAGTAAYAIRHKSTKTLDLLFNDANESQITAGNSEKYQKFVVTNESGGTGGVGLGVLDAHKEWEVEISATFSGDIDEWQLFNPETGKHQTLRTTERVVIRNEVVPNSGSFVISADTGVSCSVNGEDGICANGTGFCNTQCDSMGNCTGTLGCNQTVLKQPEVCDGLDNNCDGTVDGPEEVVFARVEVKQRNHPEIDDWTWSPTINTGTSTEEAINFVPVAGDDRVGSTEMPSAENAAQTIQGVNRSVVTFHRDGRVGDGSVSMPLLHGRRVEGGLNSVPNTTTVKMTMDRLPNEMFSTWYDDRTDDARADSVPSNYNPTTFEMEWELRRENSGAQFSREADSAVIRDLFEDAYSGSNEFELEMDNLGNLNEWRVYRPFQNPVSLDENEKLDVRLRVTSGTEATCVIQDHPLEECLGELSRYVCNNGATECKINPNGCCKDRDGDGFYGYDPLACDIGTDCDDTDPAINPGAEEVCDGIDNNCAGIDTSGNTCTFLDPNCNMVDESFPELGADCEGNFNANGDEEMNGGWDYDADGNLVRATSVGECSAVSICEDGRLYCKPTNSPSEEICDGLDNNCDGENDASIFTGGTPQTMNCPENHIESNGDCIPVPKECLEGDTLCGPLECKFQVSCVCREGLTGTDNCACAEGIAPTRGNGSIAPPPCHPGHLFDGNECHPVCGSDLDCAEGFVCDRNSRECVAPAVGQELNGAKGCQMVPGREPLELPLELGAFLGLLWLGRRRRTHAR
jgi:hypothetical protein